MKIVLDARWIFPEISGIGAYTREILGRLCQLDSRNQYLVLFSNPFIMDRTNHETGFLSKPNFSARTVPYGVFSPFSQLALPHLLNVGECDVYHSPNYMMPLLPGIAGKRPACVTTVHDVIPLVLPDHAPKSRKTKLMPLFKRVMRRSAQLSDAIITVSRRSREDIASALHLSPDAAERIYVVYNGVSEAFRLPFMPVVKTAAPANRPRMLLYVGRSDPYKNLCLLVDVLHTLKKECPFPIQLRIVGSLDSRYPEAERRARELGIRDSVTWTGYLPERDLVRLYHTADVLVHPAKYEGFGLQIIEAMSCGLPVVCSNGGSLAEVAGDAALVLAPDDTAGFVRCIRNVLTNREVVDGLVARGLKRAAQFTWERAARETLDVYGYADRRRREGR